MEIENIKELLKLFDKSSLSRLKITKDEFTLDFERATCEVVTVAKPQQIAAPVAAQPQVEHSAAAASSETKAGEIITSPMVGTLYQAPSPDSPTYAKVGDIISKGRPLAIIEAMKIMNEIEAEFDCKILEVLVKDGQAVEYDMPLFRVERV